MGGDTLSGERLAKLLENSEVDIFHLAKISGERELGQLYRDAQVEMEDVLQLRVRSTPFRPSQLPLLFLFMDSPYMFEKAFSLLWGDTFTQVTGQFLVDVLGQAEKKQLLNLALQVTVGDTVKELSFDARGNMVDPKELQDTVGVTKIPQMFQLYSNPKGSSSVHLLVESASHGLYEVRFARLPQLGDSYSLGTNPDSVSVARLRQRYFTKFQALNLYYGEVSRHFYNVVPAFYRFKVCPLL